MKPPATLHTKGCASASDWLRQEERLGPLLPSAIALTQLERDLKALTLSPLLAACRLAGLANGELKILAPSSAHAAKLNQLVPGILEGLARRGWQISAIRIRVQGKVSGPGPSENSEMKPKHAVLSSRAVDALDALAGSLESSPLKEAVARFAGRYRAR